MFLKLPVHLAYFAALRFWRTNSTLFQCLEDLLVCPRILFTILFSGFCLCCFWLSAIPMLFGWLDYSDLMGAAANAVYTVFAVLEDLRRHDRELRWFHHELL